MAGLRIDYVFLKKGNSTTQIFIDDMTKEFYQTNKDYLYCPNPLCKARIEYCEGPDRVFFRTKRSIINEEKILEQHIEECPYGIEHNANTGPKVIYDPNIGFLISDTHVLESMKRAQKQYENPSYGKGDKSKSKKRNNEVSIDTEKKDVVVKGKGVLGKTEGNQETNREPNLYQRFVSEINDKDYGQARLVKGIVTGIDYEYNSITISLNSDGGKTARMHFSEDFKVNNSRQFDELQLYQRYFSYKSSSKQEMFIICAGDVTRDDFDISVQVRSYKHIMVDGMTHNELCQFIYKFMS